MILFLILLFLSPSYAYGGQISDVPVDSWQRIPSSHLYDVRHIWSPATPGYFAAIMSAWSGGFYDSSRHRLCVKGGGHTDYGGQEMYCFDLGDADAGGTPAWSKVSEPESYAALDTTPPYNEDGLTDNDLPKSQHTYGSPVYIPSIDSVCDTNGSVGYPNVYGLDFMTCYSFTTNRWSIMADKDPDSSGTASFGAVNPVDGKYYIQGGTGSGYFGIFTPSSGTWEYGGYDNDFATRGLYLSATIDTKRNHFVAVGRGQLVVFPLSEFNAGSTKLWNYRVTNSTGETGALTGNYGAPGVAYDPVLDKIVVWTTGYSGVYVYDTDTNVWTKPALTPPDDTSGLIAQANGTYGRFQYSPKYNAFVVVNDVNKDVYVLRLSGTVREDPEPTAETTDFTSITQLTVREKASTTSADYPLTIGMPFKRGDVPSGKTVSFRTKPGQILSTQYECKRTWTDGSCKHAVLSTLIPTIPANSEVVMDVGVGGTNSAGGGMTKTQMLATDIESNIALSNFNGGCSGDNNYTGLKTTSLRDHINSGNFKYWLSGSVVTEILVHEDILDGMGRDQLNAYYEARFYPGTNWGIRISNSIENMEGSYRGNVNYDVTINMGEAFPSQKYTKTGVVHPSMSRWRKVFWLGTEPPEVEIRYDPEYLISTKLIMNYDTSLTMSEADIAAKYATWNSSNKDILQNGIISIPLGATGGREDIGIMPGWATRWLLSQDTRAYKIMLSSADLAGGLNVHWRESDVSKTTFMGNKPGHIINIQDRPTVITLYGSDTSTDTTPSDRLPADICTQNSESTVGWWSGGTIDNSHMPDLIYLPYIVTGDRYYLDELYYYAGWAVSWRSFNADWGRDYDKGYIREQVRGVAWALRQITNAAALAEDGSPEKTYFERLISNNTALWATNPFAHPLNAWGVIRTSGSEMDSSVVGITSGWMEDFVLTSLAHTDEMGYEMNQVQNWFSSFLINRCTHPDFNPYLSTAYQFPLYTTGNVAVQTWAQAKSLYTVQPTVLIGYVSEANGYQYQALAAASTITDRTNGQAAYDFLKAHVGGTLANQRTILAQNPTWAIVPRKSNTTFPSTCYDNIKNGDETAIDCGGSCSSCRQISAPQNVHTSAQK